MIWVKDRSSYTSNDKCFKIRRNQFRKQGRNLDRNLECSIDPTHGTLCIFDFLLENQYAIVACLMHNY